MHFEAYKNWEGCNPKFLQVHVYTSIQSNLKMVEAGERPASSGLKTLDSEKERQIYYTTPINKTSY